MEKDHFLLLPAKHAKSREKIIFSRYFADFAGRKKENSTLLSMSENLKPKAFSLKIIKKEIEKQAEILKNRQPKAISLKIIKKEIEKQADILKNLPPKAISWELSKLSFRQPATRLRWDKKLTST